jgi:hypothetical protein
MTRIALLWSTLALLSAAPQEEAELDRKIGRLISELGDADGAKRDRAASDLAAIGKRAIGPLKKAAADSTDAGVRARAESILDRIDWPEGGAEADGLQLTIKSKRTKFGLGSDIEVRLRVKHTGKEDRTFTLVSDGLVGRSPHGFRVVRKGPGGEKIPIGFFANLNRGPDRLSVTFPAGSEKDVTLKAFLGRETGKGGLRKELEPGAYEIAVVLGDEWGPEKRPTSLCSNWIAIEIEADK